MTAVGFFFYEVIRKKQESKEKTDDYPIKFG